MTTQHDPEAGTSARATGAPIGTRPHPRIAIVTGASSGLGAVYAHQICQTRPDLDELWLVARRKERLEHFAAEHPEIAVRAVPLDLADDAGYTELGQMLHDSDATVDILVNNAGFSHAGQFAHLRDADILSTINLDVKGMTMVSKTCLPHMRSGGVQIITGSIGAFVPLPGQAVYSASKAYTRFFARALHEELKPHGINVLLLSPGNMDTQMLQASSEDLGSKVDGLPYLDLDDVARTSLRLAAAGRATYTPRFFYQGYRLFGKLVPSAIAARLVGVG